MFRWMDISVNKLAGATTASSRRHPPPDHRKTAATTATSPPRPQNVRNVQVKEAEFTVKQATDGAPDLWRRLVSFFSINDAERGQRHLGNVV